MDTSVVKLKAKYLLHNAVDAEGNRIYRLPHYRYRERTGPRCCNANCASSRKKGGKRVAHKRLIS